MSSRRQRKEEEEELQRKKKALKKSYQREHSGKKRVGSKKFSDTQKYVLAGGIAIVIIVIVAVQFIRPPPPYCYYTEGDYILATLDQDSETISFDRLVMFYRLSPQYTTLSCDIQDFFDSAYFSTDNILVEPPEIDASINVDDIVYRFTEEASSLSFTTIMENGTPLLTSTWVDIVGINMSPSTITQGVTTVVNFKLEIIATTSVDHCNISLQFNKNLENTSIEFSSNTSGLVNEEELIFYTVQESLSANTHIYLDFDLSINTNLTSEANLLENGEIHVVINNKLLGDFAPYSDFKVSYIDFSPFLYETEPTVEKTNFLNVVVDVPYYNITIS